MKHRARLLLGVFVVGVLAGFIGTATYAAPESAVSPVSASSQMTVFDPFTLKTITIQSESAGAAVDMSALVAMARPPIRIPFRPPLRSPFMPDW